MVKHYNNNYIFYTVFCRKLVQHTALLQKYKK